MAASKIVDNGPFDPRITAIPFLESSYWDPKNGWQANPNNKAKLTRGFVITEKPIAGAYYRCNFLYNPSVINLSHQIDNNVMADQNSQNPYDVTSGQFLMPLQQSVTFSLLFDRTYEMWDGSKLSGDAAIQVPMYGVAYDILSLYKITGIASPMTAPSTGTDTSSGQDLSTTTTAFQKGQFAGGPAGPMVATPVYAVLGPSLSYYGYITELDVQFTHWTQQMVPIRGQVGVTMTLLPTPQGGNKYAPIYGPKAPGVGNPLQNPTPSNTGKSGR